MRRIMLGVVMMSAMACDPGYDDAAELGHDDSAEGSTNERALDELVAEGEPMATGTNATVTLVSWVKEGELVSKVACDDFTVDAPYVCHCNADSDLVGVPNVINGGDQCVLCRWSDWENDTCELSSNNDVDVRFISNGSAMYTYVDDAMAEIVPSGPHADPAPSWTLSHCELASSCLCTTNECTCGDGYLGFTAQQAHGSGTSTQMVVRGHAQIQLAPGSC